MSVDSSAWPSKRFRFATRRGATQFSHYCNSHGYPNSGVPGPKAKSFSVECLAPASEMPALKEVANAFQAIAPATSRGRSSHSTVKNYGALSFRIFLGGLRYQVIIKRDWERGGFVAKLVSEGVGTIMEPNGKTPGEALAALVRDLRAGDATDQKLAAHIAQRYWGSATGDVEATP